MEGVELERLERVARNMPAQKLAMHRIDWKHGVIYFAYGTGQDGTIHGLWGCRGVARTLDFKPGTDEEHVRQGLVNDAASYIETCVAKDLMHA